MSYFLSTRLELLTELAFVVRDLGDERWSEAEKCIAINSALRSWSNRVRIPFVYSLSVGYVSTSWTVALPSFIDTRFMRPQVRSNATDNAGTLLTNPGPTWVDLVDYVVEPDGEGGSLIRVPNLYDSEARIVFWVSPGPLPGATPVVPPAVLLDSTTSMTISTDVNSVPICGFIKIGNEWIQYNGLTDAGGTLTITNLARGINGTPTSVHSPGASVDWGIGYDRRDLLNQLFMQAQSELMLQYLVNASPQEREAFQFSMRWAQQRADEYWRSYSSAYQPMIIIDTR